MPACIHISVFQTHDTKVKMEIIDLSVAAKFPLICIIPVNTLFWSHNTTNSNNSKYATHETRDYQNCSFGSPTLAFHFVSLIFPYFQFSNTVPNNVRNTGPNGDLFFTVSILELLFMWTAFGAVRGWKLGLPSMRMWIHSLRAAAPAYRKLGLLWTFPVWKQTIFTKLDQYFF